MSKIYPVAHALCPQLCANLRTLTIVFSGAGLFIILERSTSIYLCTDQVRFRTFGDDVNGSCQGIDPKDTGSRSPDDFDALYGFQWNRQIHVVMCTLWICYFDSVQQDGGLFK